MNINPAIIIDDFLTTKREVFSVDEFFHSIKKQGVKFTKNDAREVLYTSDLVFPLVNNEFITRAGVFTGRWFSFMPTKEEIQKGYIIIGHRAMPFINPEIPPDRVCLSTPRQIIPMEKCVFSMNMATECFSLYGEGYVLPYIFGDHSNEKLSLASIQYAMPSEIQLTAWPLKEITGGENFQLGDRLLCKVMDWKDAIIQVEVLHADSSNAISISDMEREDWYSTFEKGLISCIEKNGPASSIEEQLAYLYLEHQEELCIPNCGSIEEFFKHTKKIAFTPFGVETRIWKVGEEIPFAGEWNKDASAEVLYMQVNMIFSPKVLDAYVLNYYSEKKVSNSQKTMDELIDEIFPFSYTFSAAERKLITEQIEKRSPVLLAQNEFYEGSKIPPLRKQIVELYSKVSRLVCQISKSGLMLSDLPSQELIILMQLFSHIYKIIEEIEDTLIKDQIPVDELMLSLEGMEETFYDIQGVLKNTIDTHTYKDIKIVE